MREKTLFLLLLATFLPLVIANCNDYTAHSITMDIYPDGSVNVEYKIKSDPYSARVNVTLPGDHYTDLLVYDEDGIILDWAPINGGIEIDSIGAEELSISYSSVSLTNKTGSLWTVSVNTEAPTNYLLPVDSVLVGISSTPSSISIINNRAAITMLPGLSRISYSLGATESKEVSMVLLLQAQAIIQEANKLNIDTTLQEINLDQAINAFEASSYTQSELISQQIIEQTTEIIEFATQANDQIIDAQELLTFKNSVIDAGTIETAQAILDEAIAEYESGEYLSAYTYASETIQLLEQAKPVNQNNVFLIGSGLIFITGLVGYYLYSHRNKPVDLIEEAPDVDLDKVFKYKSNLRTDEKAVLRFIEESGGAFITEVRKRFDIPKSSAWRMVKRLEEEEVVSVSMVGRETYLQLRYPGGIR